MDKVQTLRIDALAFGRDLHEFATEVLSRQTAAQNDKQRIFLFAQAVRMYRTAEAVCKLVEHDLNDAAGAVLRCLLEQLYVFSAVNIDAAHLQVLANESSAESYKALSGLRLMAVESRHEDLTDDVLRASIEEFTQRSVFNACDWASRGGFGDSYRTLWRTLCDYAHGSSAIVGEYLKFNESGAILGIRSNIANIPSIEFVLVASGIVLEAVATLDMQGNTPLIQAKAEELSEAQRTLYAKFWDLKNDPLHGKSA